MILIAGGSGFYGINTARCLADRGQEVLLVQRHAIQPPSLLADYWGKQIHQAAGSVLDLSFLISLVKKYSIDSIIHAAHQSSGIRAQRPGEGEDLHQLLETQIVGFMNCLEAARLMDLRRVMFTSSVDLYRGLPRQCDVWQEDAYLPPLSFSEIGNSKRAMEQIGLLYNRQYGLSVISLRIGANYGQVCGNMGINAMVNNALEGKKVKLSMLAANRRTHPVYARDTAEASCAVHLAESPQSYIYNISDGTHPTMQEIAGVVREVIPGADIELGLSGDDVEFRPVIIDRMKDEFGFIPRTLKEGIAAYAAFVKEGKY